MAPTDILEIKPHADILDVCCGPRMFYADSNKNRSDVIYMDIRDDVTIEYEHKNGTISTWKIKPDIVGDFRHIPFKDNSFSLVIFDPPHLLNKNNGIIKSKYGALTENWKKDIEKGFKECIRVLKPEGFLNFKWSNTQIPLAEISALFPFDPIYYQRRNTDKTSGYWAMFRKGDNIPPNQKTLDLSYEGGQ